MTSKRNLDNLMSNIDALLIDLCEPYLLDLIGLLAQRMRRFDDKIQDIAEEGGYDLTEEVIVSIDNLNGLQKAEVLAAAANHVLAIAQREREA